MSVLNISAERKFFKMKIKESILLYIIVIMSLFIFSGCGVKDVAGSELVKKARAEYTKLDSAKVIMTNTQTNEVEQSFVFKYDEKDVLTFAYEGKYQDESYAQYNNGFECYTSENGEYTFTQRGDKDFQAYDRDSTYPQASEGLIIFSVNAVEESSVSEENGTTCVEHKYDPEKIGATASEGNVTDFIAKFYFDENEELLYFTEETVVDSGEETVTHSYKVEITEKNAVEDIENPVQIPE